jgi:hypothetical protein
MLCGYTWGYQRLGEANKVFFLFISFFLGFLPMDDSSL